MTCLPNLFKVNFKATASAIVIAVSFLVNLYDYRLIDAIVGTARTVYLSHTQNI